MPVSFDRRVLLRSLPFALGGCAAQAPRRSPEAIELRPVPAVAFTNAPTPPALLTERMSHYGSPGLSIALIREGRVAQSRVHGVKRAGAAEPVRPSTAFQAASLSKPVAAVGALLLVDAGAIALDDDIRPLLKTHAIRFIDGVPPQPITLRALLSHTAGVNVPSYPGFAPGSPLPSLSEILDGAPLANSPPVAVAHAPGTHRYSGGGYQLVEQLIEDITGQSFTAYMRARVFDPLGMRRTAFAPAPPASFMDDVAAGHGWSGRAREHAWLIYPQRAAASLWSTPADLARLLCAVIESYAGASGGLLSPPLAQTMLSETVPGMGLGFGVHGEGEGRVASHAGWTRGYRSYLAAFPERGEGIVVMANGDRGNELSMEVVRGAARELGWANFEPRLVQRAELAPQVLEGLAGEYRFEQAGFSVTAQRDGDLLIVRTPREASYTFHPIDERTLIAVEDGAVATFTTEGGVQALRLWDMRAVRVR